MKHIFYIYNMARVDDHIFYNFLDKIKSEFSAYGYDIDSEILFIPLEKKYELVSSDSQSAIVISTDGVCNETSAYSDACGLWPYIEEKIDLILIGGRNPIVYWPSLSTPVMPLEKLNYSAAVKVLINSNS